MHVLIKLQHSNEINKDFEQRGDEDFASCILHLIQASLIIEYFIPALLFKRIL